MNKEVILPNGDVFNYYAKSNLNDNLEMNPDEVEAINAILEKLNYEGDFSIKKTSITYTTLLYKQYDLFRIRVDKNERSIRIFMPPELKSKYIDNNLFTNQKNKNQLYWFSYINNLFDYNDILLDVIEWINKA